VAIDWKYPLHEDGVYYCIPKSDQELHTFIEPNLDTGPWIAGGAALRWYEGKSLDDHDVDIFCSSQEQYDNVNNKIYARCIDDPTAYCITKLFETDNASTLRIDKIVKNSDSLFGLNGIAISWKIQLIKKFMPANLDELLDKFDISVCKVATDFKKFKVNPEAARDIKAKRLYFPNGFKPDSLKRIVKYNAYGYTPDPDIWDKLFQVEGLVTKFHPNVGDYDNAF
jgi:hypothetical protein